MSHAWGKIRLAAALWCVQSMHLDLLLLAILMLLLLPASITLTLAQQAPPVRTEKRIFLYLYISNRSLRLAAMQAARRVGGFAAAALRCFLCT
jgi:hypothetical protein